MDSMPIDPLDIERRWSFKAEFNFPVEQLFNEHWKNFDCTPQFSRNASFVRRVEVLTPFVDVIHVSQDDFLCLCI